METAVLSTKGQLVIPQKLRRALHLHAGDKVAFALQGDQLLVKAERSKRARLITTRGRKLLVAPAGAPPMKPELVKQILADSP
jgi:AbrB family looped-hinge helix DNA binding protein